MSTKPVAPTPPPGYTLEGVPAFEQPLVPSTSVEVKPANPNYAAEVSPLHPRTIQFFGKDQETQPTTTHEMSHVWQDSRNLSVLADTMSDVLHGKVGKGYDYGGIDGLLAAQRQHKTIADFGPEQQADMVADYQQQTQQAIKSGDAALLDRVNQAYGPFIRQFAALPPRGASMTAMTEKDLTPPAPGLPPATETGILEPNPLLGGPTRVLKNPPTPPPGYALEK